MKIFRRILSHIIPEKTGGNDSYVVSYPSIIGEHQDINLRNGYKLTKIIFLEYEREYYSDEAIRCYLETPEGKELSVLYDIEMRRANRYYKLSFIECYWELTQEIWDEVENVLTDITY